MTKSYRGVFLIAAYSCIYTDFEYILYALATFSMNLLFDFLSWVRVRKSPISSTLSSISSSSAYSI